MSGLLAHPVSIALTLDSEQAAPRDAGGQSTINAENKPRIVSASSLPSALSARSDSAFTAASRYSFHPPIPSASRNSVD